MIERTHQGPTAYARALYSPCETYRYLLSRDWGEAGGSRLLYILLNPSTATEAKNDPTIERCERRARGLGYAGFVVANLFALRATDPAHLCKVADPIGPANDAILQRAAQEAGSILCGWGVHGSLQGRGAALLTRLRAQGHSLSHLGLTRDLQPRHPLYVSYATAPMLWSDNS